MGEKDEGRKTADVGAPPKPRLGWLTAFQLAVIALVVLMARLTQSDGLTSQTQGWGARDWLPAVVAMVSALLLMLPIAWAYVATRERRGVDHSLVTTLTLLPIAVAAILVIVQDSLAVAFSLAGIAGLVRFRNALDDPRDAMYVIVAIAVGLGAGVGALHAAAALSGLYNLVSVALWKWNASRPIIADIALGEHPVPEGHSVLEEIVSPKERERHPAPVAEWFEPAATKPLVNGAPPAEAQPAPEQNGNAKRDGMLRVHAADDMATRREVEEVLNTHAKRWALESDDRGADGLPTLTYEIRLKKRYHPSNLLEALQERLGPKLAEYTPINGSSPRAEGRE